MSKSRLDQALVSRGLTATRSRAENYIKLGYAKINGSLVYRPGALVGPQDKIQLTIKEQYVSRAALKLASVAGKLQLDFEGKTVLDVGSSTGGFTDYALRCGAKKVIAVDVGSDQMHPSLSNDLRVELYQKTDIRDYSQVASVRIDIVLIDVSFISLREILPSILNLITRNTEIVAMCKPQFESGSKGTHKGVIKNDAMRRAVLKNFEDWVKKTFKIIDKADSSVAGTKGNLERFYLIKALQESLQ